MNIDNNILMKSGNSEVKKKLNRHFINALKMKSASNSTTSMCKRAAELKVNSKTRTLVYDNLGLRL